MNDQLEITFRILANKRGVWMTNKKSSLEFKQIRENWFICKWQIEGDEGFNCCEFHLRVC